MEQLLNLNNMGFIIWGAIFIALIYLVFKRVEDKSNETFEKRDN